MKKILLIIMLMIFTIIPIYANNYGAAVIDCENGYGWVFVYSNVEGYWSAMSAFKGRSIDLNKGTYTFAFSNYFNDGVPTNNSEYQIMEIKDNKKILVKTDFVFKD